MIFDLLLSITHLGKKSGKQETEQSWLSVQDDVGHPHRHSFVLQ